MKYFRLALVTCSAISSLLTASAYGATYYVDAVSGNDGSDGLTAETAWKTIGHAYPSPTGPGGVKSGDTVILAGTPTYATLNQVQVTPRIDGVLLTSCDTPWNTDAQGVSVVTDSQAWFPTQTANKITIPANFAASQKIAYTSFNAVDLSKFSKPRLHLWFRQENDGTSQSDKDKIRPNNLKVALCSDAQGNIIVAERVIDFYMYMGWYFAHLDLQVLGDLSGVQSIAFYTTPTWNYYANATLWLDDITVADGDMHMKLTKPNHGYPYHANDIVKVTQGINDETDTKIFPVANADNDNIIITSNYGGENQFQPTISCVVKNAGYGKFAWKVNNAVNTDWITYKANDGEWAVFDTVGLGGDNGGKYNGDYYLRFENIDIELITNPNTYLAFMPGVGYVTFDHCKFLGGNKYLSWSMLTGRSNSALSNHITITDSEIKRVSRGINFTCCSSCVAANNSVYDVSESGLHLDTADNCLIENNIFNRRRTGSDQWWHNSPHGGGISFRPCHNITVRGNIIHNGFTRGIGHYSGDVYDIVFERNVIYDIQGSYLFTPNASGDTIGPIWFLNNTIISYRDYSYIPRKGNTANYALVYPQSIVLRLRDYPNSLLGQSRIENNILIGRFELSGTNFIEKNNIIFDNGLSTQPAWDSTTILLASEIDKGNLDLNVLDEHFFVNPNFTPNHQQECDYHPYTGSLACTMPLGPVGALPCLGEVLYGDVSNDTEVTAYDAALVAQAGVGLITLTADQTKAADVSGDGQVTAYDSALIAQRAVGLINKFPAEGG